MSDKHVDLLNNDVDNDIDYFVYLYRTVKLGKERFKDSFLTNVKVASQREDLIKIWEDDIKIWQVNRIVWQVAAEICDHDNDKRDY